MPLRSRSRDGTPAQAGLLLAMRLVEGDLGVRRLVERAVEVRVVVERRARTNLRGDVQVEGEGAAGAVRFNIRSPACLGVHAVGALSTPTVAGAVGDRTGLGPSPWPAKLTGTRAPTEHQGLPRLSSVLPLRAHRAVGVPGLHPGSGQLRCEPDRTLTQQPVPPQRAAVVVLARVVPLLHARAAPLRTVCTTEQSPDRCGVGRRSRRSAGRLGAERIFAVRGTTPRRQDGGSRMQDV